MTAAPGMSRISAVFFAVSPVPRQANSGAVMSRMLRENKHEIGRLRNRP